MVPSMGPNTSLDASGGVVFLNLLGAANGASIRAAASTQTLGPMREVRDQDMPQLEYVCSQIQREIRFFRKKRNYNRAMSLLFVCAAAVLSALATVSLGASKMLNKP